MLSARERTHTGMALTTTSETYDNYRCNTPLLTANDEIVLATAIRAGRAADDRLNSGEHLSRSERRRLRQTSSDGEAARIRFVNANLRLVIAIARKFPTRNGVELDDVIQAGNIGLLRAVEKFDPDMGWKFSTYAKFWIRQAIQRSEREWYLIGMPHNEVSTLRTAMRHDSALSDDQEQLRTMMSPSSIDAERPGGGGAGDGATYTIADLIADPAPVEAFGNVESGEAAERIDETVSDIMRSNPMFDHVDRQIIGLRVGPTEMSFVQIAAIVGISIHQVRRRYPKIIAALAADDRLQAMSAAA